MTVYCHSDPKAAGVPDSVINFFSKRVIYMGQQNLIKGDIFYLPELRRRILENLPLASQVAKFMNVPVPDVTNPKDYFCPEHKRKE